MQFCELFVSCKRQNESDCGNVKAMDNERMINW